MAKVITDAAQALIGVEQAPVTTDIEKSDVRRFASAIAYPNDPNPLYSDEQYASATEYGGVIAPPTFCTSLAWLGVLLEQINPTMGKYRVGLNGGSEYELLSPVRPGDTLAARPKLASLNERDRDDGGVMLILLLQADFYNQRDEKVLVAKQTLLRIYGPENLGA